MVNTVVNLPQVIGYVDRVSWPSWRRVNCLWNAGPSITA